jgi:DNA topoisomerase I
MKNNIRFVDDSIIGITRLKAGKTWNYVNPRGKPIKSRAEINRLNAIALPPAYKDGWFCPDPYGHIQAIGWDAKGRKQYRYHPDFRAARENDKYAQCVDFGASLPAIRRRVESDLALRDVGRASVLAAVVRLLDLGKVRIGNESYARTNKSYGATTLRKRHVKVKGHSVKLDYVGKSGKTQSVSIEDKRLAHVVRKCLDTGGLLLFEYADESGAPRAVSSTDVNQYLRDASGREFTAKHFRTWGASVIALNAALSQTAEISLKSMLEPVAKALGNTPAIARKSYVHPQVIELATAARKLQKLRNARPHASKYMTSSERVLLQLLKSKRPRGAAVAV